MSDAKIELAVSKAAKLRYLEDEVGRSIAPFIHNRNKMQEIATRSSLRTNYLLELGKIGAGMKRRHRLIHIAKKTG